MTRLARILLAFACDYLQLAIVAFLAACAWLALDRLEGLWR
jgi:hypothetical protein